MTKVTLLQTEDPITLVTPPNISEFLKAQLNDGKPGAALVKDVEAQIEQAASDAFGKEYVFRATIDDNGSVRIFQILDVVETVTDEYRQVSLHNARKIKSGVELGAKIANTLEYDELVKPFGVLTTANMKIKNIAVAKADV